MRLLVLCVGTLVALGAFGLVRLTGSSCMPLSRTPCVRVLFLGNSHTYVNDLPTVFRELARSGGQNVETGMVANGGETLAEHAAAPESVAAIRGSSWAFVVLQEQSEIPAFAGVRERQMDPAGRSLVGTIRTAGATPILLETWAHRDGMPSQRLGYPQMQAAITEGYRVLGAELGVAVAPAGQAWQTAHRRDPGIVLWQADGNHPTLAGTYLAACVLYARDLQRQSLRDRGDRGPSARCRGHAPGRRRPALTHRFLRDSDERRPTRLRARRLGAPAPSRHR